MQQILCMSANVAMVICNTPFYWLCKDVHILMGMWDKTITQRSVRMYRVYTPRGCTPLTKALGAQPGVYTLYTPLDLCVMI